ncbi:hypothetical protein IWX49DRAFT_156307 [Phyllosticta citricarpa]|uniref:Transmembrane protein n=1 Tax=Phyllosticta citricarpa TaxID=55181 RepID=A0ABR1MHS3_9PEZI
MSDFPADKESQPASARGASIPPSSLFLNLLTLEPHQADTGSTTFNSSAHREESHRGSIVQPNPTTHTHTLSLSLRAKQKKAKHGVQFHPLANARFLLISFSSSVFHLVGHSFSSLAGWLAVWLFVLLPVSQPAVSLLFPTSSESVHANASATVRCAGSAGEARPSRRKQASCRVVSCRATGRCTAMLRCLYFSSGVGLLLIEQ